jgi:DNA-binding NtrC family response regulator
MPKEEKEGAVTGGEGAVVAERMPLKAFLDRTEKEQIIAVLRETEGHVSLAHARLGISRKSFYDKIGKYAIDLSLYRKAGDKGGS